MTDDKVIEAMAEAIWLAEPGRIGSRRHSVWSEESEDTKNKYRPLARAAIAAADKVRAEAIRVPEYERELRQRVEFTGDTGSLGHIDPAVLAAIFAELDTLRAGLAKGEAERAVLVEERTKLSKKNVELQRGDLIEVKRIELHGAIVKDRWLLASIVRIVGHSILAIGLSNDNLNVQKWFPLSERGNTWR